MRTKQTPVTASKNATAQALKRLNPNLNKREFFTRMNIPMCQLSTARYWEECYNILPWHQRTEAEKEAALKAAGKL